MCIAKEMTDELRETTKEILSNPKMFLKPPTEDDIDRMYAKIEEQYFTNLNKAARYLSWVYNYSLVMMCGIFDAFLEDSMEVALRHSSPTEPLLSLVTNYLKVFSKKDLKSRLQDYEHVLGISQKEFFDFSLFTQDIQDKYKVFNQEKLREIYAKRIAAAHSDQVVISKEELVMVSDVLQKIMINLSQKIGNKSGIPTQLKELAS